MSRIVEEDAPGTIRTHPANEAYLDNWSRNFGPVYYAHPIWFYGTDLERTDVEEITRRLGDVLNPNAPEHEAAYLARRAATGKGMDYFLEDVLPACRACVFRADTDGRISSGVALEVAWFVERGMPTYEIVDGALVLASYDATRALTREETRERVSTRR